MPCRIQTWKGTLRQTWKESDGFSSENHPIFCWLKQIPNTPEKTHDCRWNSCFFLFESHLLVEIKYPPSLSRYKVVKVSDLAQFQGEMGRDTPFFYVNLDGKYDNINHEKMSATPNKKKDTLTSHLLGFTSPSCGVSSKTEVFLPALAIRERTFWARSASETPLGENRCWLPSARG